jgi:hypothetical protein
MAGCGGGAGQSTHGARPTELLRTGNVATDFDAPDGIRRHENMWFFVKDLGASPRSRHDLLRDGDRGEAAARRLPLPVASTGG